MPAPDFVQRLLRKDAALFHGGTAAKRLGWVDHRPPVKDLVRFAREAKDEGIREVLLLGMGGSALFPRVLASSFPCTPGFPAVSVLDTTDPASVRAATGRLDPARTLVLIASKSGTTIEVSSLYRHVATVVRGGLQYAAITDPGSPLEGLARKAGFRAVFAHPPDVGGRYSAMTVVGLLPAALMGVDLQRLLDDAASADPERGVRLGADLAKRDRLFLRQGWALAPWVEQLVAESTGKDGKGIVPVPGEEGPVEGNGNLAREARLWMIATAAACRALGVDPFDEPDVKLAKDLTRTAIDHLVEHGRLPEEPASPSPEEVLRSAGLGDYVAVLSWLPQTEHVYGELSRMKRLSRAPVTLHAGPRYLHSTGQLHKGGPPTGVFLQFTCEEEDLPIPGEPYGFSALRLAQAWGDREALRRRGRRLAHVHLGADPLPAVRALMDRLEAAPPT